MGSWKIIEAWTQRTARKTFSSAPTSSRPRKRIELPAPVSHPIGAGVELLVAQALVPVQDARSVRVDPGVPLDKIRHRAPGSGLEARDLQARPDQPSRKRDAVSKRQSIEPNRPAPGFSSSAGAHAGVRRRTQPLVEQLTDAIVRMLTTDALDAFALLRGSRHEQQHQRVALHVVALPL